MKRLILLLLLGTPLLAVAQDFNKIHKEQLARIENAYSKNQLSEPVYTRLLNEQVNIQLAIDKFNTDGVLTPKEKRKLTMKQNKARKQLNRYLRKAHPDKS